MKQIKTLHQNASDTLWEIGLRETLIKGKQDTIQKMKPMMVDDTQWQEQLSLLKLEKAELKIKYKDQLAKLLTSIEKL